MGLSMALAAVLPCNPITICGRAAKACLAHSATCLKWFCVSCAMLPQNILLTLEGRAKVADVGLAQLQLEEEEGAGMPLRPSTAAWASLVTPVAPASAHWHGQVGRCIRPAVHVTPCLVLAAQCWRL